MKNFLERRSFLKASAAIGSALGLPFISKANNNSVEAQIERANFAPKPVGKSVIGLKMPPIAQVRVAFIGVGNRGSGHVKLVHACGAKAKIVAVCDIQERYTNRTKQWLEKQGVNDVAYYHTKVDAWKEMCRRDDIDLVIIATPWEDHVPMCVYAMQQGKHAATEVPAAYTLEDCWKLVNTAEQTQRNCMMLENVCYGDEELWLLNMANEGLFGTLTYAECGYIHDLREMLFSKTDYYNMWRIRHNYARDGNLYPMHGLGPVAQYMNIDRGDRFNHLVSMSSLEASLSEDSTVMTDPTNEFHGRKGFKKGDMNNTLIKTHLGRSILVQHDIVTARPYSRINMLAGTKAFHMGYPSHFSKKGQGHGFLKEEEYKALREQYKHPIWAKMKDEIEKNGGHGGMDFVLIYRLIDCFNRGTSLDMDVYDAASWSSVTPLSALSIQGGNAPVKFPDFTRGRWKEARKLGMLVNV
ncbi:Gfo/Idh/MocA family oxidoreductase [Runella sp. CRIBMP]|uniref:Gfo/Idh/MocA family protein n=1 Tax=Runella sp. CRIBMP TaxID=2683261 RepID=UPI0014125966|nr:Gfo/Idh/MocA family oxidoreductase [Runella sp. CRIBMP]NBB21664.1 Gfo/Idh/MocA family oxidoreductase [Runella sp. CRIBMP]